MNLPAVPTEKFGTSATRYNLPALPADLPTRDLLQAANNFNDYRHHGLTTKQRLFVDEYLRNAMDEGKAAVAAGLAPWSPDMAEAGRVGRRLLRKRYIQHTLDLAFAYHGETVKAELPAVIGEIKKIAFANLADVFRVDEFGTPRIHMPDTDEREIWAAISEVSITPGEFGTKYKVKQHAKLEALEKLLKFVQATGFKGNNGGDDRGGGGASATAVNSVSVLNIVSVPSGQFVPAPVESEVAPLSVEYSVNPA